MFGMTPWKKQRQDGGTMVPSAEFPLRRLRNEFDTLFDRFFAGWPAPLEAMGMPAQWGWGFDLEDAGNEYVVRAEAPGFEAGDFDVQLANNWLTIKAEHKEGDGKEGEEVRRQFQRSFTLPAGADPDKVEARYRNGVLEVHLGKTAEAQGRRITVQA